MHLSYSRALLLALVGVSLSSACSRPPSATAAAPPGPDVWAVVGDSQIRRDDVEKAFRRVTPLEPKPSEEEALAAKLRIVNELIDQEILLQKARSLKVEVPAADVDKAFNERKSNMPDDAFQKELSQRGLTADDMRRALANELTVRKVLEQEVGAKAAVNDEAIRDFYEKNRAQFNLAEARYRIAQIVITPVRDQQISNRTNHDATTPADAERKAQMVMERIKSGADFATVAMDYSEDPQSAPQGGDLGFVPASALNQVAPELRRAVLATKPGQVSAVSAGGAHIIFMLVAHDPAGQRDLNTPGVKEGINDLLRDRREQLLTAAYISAARSEVKVVNTLAQQIVAGGGKMPPGLVPGAPGR
jgi:peptidyl-prolyl cis-trans isomerase SurA